MWPPRSGVQAQCPSETLPAQWHAAAPRGFLQQRPWAMAPQRTIILPSSEFLEQLGRGERQVEDHRVLPLIGAVLESLHFHFHHFRRAPGFGGKKDRCAEVGVRLDQCGEHCIQLQDLASGAGKQMSCVCHCLVHGAQEQRI